MSDLKDLVGKRILARVGQEEDEYEIIEISPSGRMVKLINLEGYTRWYEAGSIAVGEVLEDISTQDVGRTEDNDIEFAKRFAHRAECAKKLIDSVFK
jgi:hypothetical protein